MEETECVWSHCTLRIRKDPSVWEGWREGFKAVSVIFVISNFPAMSGKRMQEVLSCPKLSC